MSRGAGGPFNLGAIATGFLSAFLAACGLSGGCDGKAGELLRAIQHPDSVTTSELEETGGPGGGTACLVELEYEVSDEEVENYYRAHLEGSGWEITEAEFGGALEAARQGAWLELRTGSDAWLRAEDTR